jgi:hypothetical protein
VKTVTVVVKDGGIELKTQGFEGPACLQEFEEIARRLSELGVSLETSRTVLLSEYYTAVRQDTKVASGRR